MARRNIFSVSMAILLLGWYGNAFPLDCPKAPEQVNNDWNVEVAGAVAKIGPVKAGELRTKTKRTTQDLLAKIPDAGRIYLEQMMYSAYCTALRDDKTITEAEKARRLKQYNSEVRKTISKQPATSRRIDDTRIIFDPKPPYIVYTYYRNDQTNENYPVHIYSVGVKNLSKDTAAKNMSIKVTRLLNYESRKWVDEERFVPFDIEYKGARDIKPEDEVSVPIAKIAHPAYQKKYDTGLWGGDLNQPQFRFFMYYPPRWINSHVPPGKHRFKIAIHFENRPSVEKEFMFEWSGRWFSDPKSGDFKIESYNPSS